MMELSTDAFGDAMVKGFSFMDIPIMDSYVEDHHSTVHQQPIFAGSAYSQIIENKPSHQASEQKDWPWMSTLSEPEAFFRSSTSFVPLASWACQQQQLQQTVDGSSPYCLPYSQHPGHEDSNMWITRDILDNSPSTISIPESPPWVSTPINASFDTIPPLDLCKCPICLPDSQLLEKAVRYLEDEPPPAKSPGNPYSTVKSSRSVSTTNSAPVCGAEVSFLSATPAKSRKPRGSRRCRLKGSEKSKKVPNVSQLAPVVRERQRRDEMSLKMSTLECLLPSAISPNLKRDKGTILDESSQYLRYLQTKVEELKIKFAELKLEKSARRAAAWSEPLKLGSHGLGATSSRQPLVEFHVQVEDDGQTAASSEKCRCRPDFLSSAMKVLELLNLDVSRCAITKVSDHTICVILAKVWEIKLIIEVSDALIELLARTLQLERWILTLRGAGPGRSVLRRDRVYRLLQPRLSTSSTQVPTSASVVSAIRSSLQLSIMKKEGYDPPLQRRPANAGASLGPRQREPGEEEDLCRDCDLPCLCLEADEHANAPHPRLIPKTSIAR